MSHGNKLVAMRAKKTGGGDGMLEHAFDIKPEPVHCGFDIVSKHRFIGIAAEPIVHVVVPLHAPR